MVIAVMTMLVKILGAVLAFKIVALTGGTEENKRGKQQEEAFHGTAI